MRGTSNSRCHNTIINQKIVINKWKQTYQLYFITIESNLKVSNSNVLNPQISDYILSPSHFHFSPIHSMCVMYFCFRCVTHKSRIVNDITFFLWNMFFFSKEYQIKKMKKTSQTYAADYIVCSTKQHSLIAWFSCMRSCV